MLRKTVSSLILVLLAINMFTLAFRVQPSNAAGMVYYSVEPVAVAPLTNINSSVNGLETPSTPSPVGQSFKVEIHLRGATVANVPAGVDGVEVVFNFADILPWAVPTGFLDMTGKTGGVLTGPTVLYSITPGFYDASGKFVLNAPYTGAVYYEVAGASSVNREWNGTDGLVAVITFQIIRQPQGSNGESTVNLTLTNDYTDLADINGNAISHDRVQGTLTIDVQPGEAGGTVHYSVEPVAIAPLTDVNSSINDLETPPMPSPVGQNFTVEIHLRNTTSTNVPTGVSGLEVHFYFGNILAYAVPTGFTCTLGQPSWVLTGPTLLYGISPGFYDASGNMILNPPYTGAVYFEIAAVSTSGRWNGADGLVATINFQIIKQPQGQNGEPTVTLPLANDFTVLVDPTASTINCDRVQGTLSIDTTTALSPPVASFSYSPPLPITEESITFDASSSSPGWNGTQMMPIVSYTWDFGDNNTATGQVVAHAYADSGNYTVTLNVTDSEGSWLAEQRLIQVVQPLGPVAEFTVSPETGRVGEAMDFNASSSIEGWNFTSAVPITEYSWDFGDGNITSTNDNMVAHAYAGPGTFNVTMTVLDAEGMYSSCSANVSVVMPTLVSVATSSTSVLGSGVAINGTLRDAYGNGLENETVVLFYTFVGVNSWYPISSGVTDSLGNYYVQWFPAATGYFTIEAEWVGNTTYSGTSSTTTLSTLPYQNQYVFSVESNSTISGLAFNTTDWTLSFTASGPSGTTGYTKITVAKSLAANPANITVYLDGNQTGYSITSTDDSWLLTLNYTHSTHEVVVDLNTGAIPEFPQMMILPLLALLTMIVSVVLRKRKGRTERTVYALL